MQKEGKETKEETKETIRIGIMAGILAIFFGIYQSIPKDFKAINMDFALKFLSINFFQILLIVYLSYFLLLALNYGYNNLIKPKCIEFIFDLIITLTIIVIFLTFWILGTILLVMNFPQYIQAGWKTNILIYGAILASAIFFYKNLDHYRKKLGIFMINKKIKKDKKIIIPMNKKIISIIEWILSITIPTLAIIWLGGMLIQLTKMTITDYTPFIGYAQISLTFFGFTLIGAIFEKNKLKDSKIIKSLFHYSMIFLSSAIGFFMLYSISFITFPIGDDLFGLVMKIVIFGSMVVSYGGLIYGSLGLLKRLISYRKEI